VVLYLIVASLWACSEAPTPPVEPPPEPPEKVEPPPDEAQPGQPSPEGLYARCEERVEQPQVEGECSSDDDCVRAGCSREVCTSASSAEGLNTTCEGRVCFAVLDTCGCVEGTCRWSLKKALPIGDGEPPPAGKLGG
jgi:eight-cysteine-cluster-containing protein